MTTITVSWKMKSVFNRPMENYNNCNDLEDEVCVC